MWLKINDNYSASSEGQIRNDKYDRLLKPFKQGNYLAVWLGAGNKKYVHRIIGELFLPKINLENIEIDHINRNKNDNRAENLRYCNHYENMKNRNKETKPRKTNQLGEFGISQEKRRKDTFVVSLKGQRLVVIGLANAIEKRNQILECLTG